PVVPMKLKVEINCREHFAVQGYEKVSFGLDTNWFKGECELVTFKVEELLATKMRALYQRKQGRDIFDLYRASDQLELNVPEIVKGFKHYMNHEDHPVKASEYVANVEAKLKEDEFTGDTTS